MSLKEKSILVTTILTENGKQEIFEEIYKESDVVFAVQELKKEIDEEIEMYVNALEKGVKNPFTKKRYKTTINVLSRVEEKIKKVFGE